MGSGRSASFVPSKCSTAIMKGSNHDEALTNGASTAGGCDRRRQSLGSLEQDLQRKPTERRGQIMFPYTTDRREALRAAIGTRIDMGIFLSEGQVWGVVEAVRNLLLNWSLELEKAGVLGEEMSFTDAEKAEASTVTQQFIIQNVGVLGNVSGSAKVSNEQTATTSLDVAAVRDFADQAIRNLSSLPEEIRRELEPLIKEIHSELR